MQVNGVSTPSVTTTPTAVTPPKPEATSAPADTKPAAIQPKHDTVELTGAALAKSLKLSGQNPAQIAQKMGLDIKTVDSYLSIKVATPTPSAPTATPASAPVAVPQAQHTATNTAAIPQPATQKKK